MKRLSLFVLLTCSISIWAQGQGGIPMQYMNDPAVDLIYNGKALMPDEVHELIESSKGRFDISTLNPDETSDLWKNNIGGQLPEDKNPIGDLDEVKYHSPAAAESGIFRFNVQHDLSGKLYTMMLTKNLHSFLMVKSLLRKLGYVIPDMKHIPRVVLSFKNDTERGSFVSHIQHVAMAGNPSSWIVEELDGSKLILQDLVIMESNHIIYNLAYAIKSDVIQGRRLLSSLSVPLTIVNVAESVNLLRWNACNISNKKVILFHNKAEDFLTTWEDARWISRRIEKLTLKDWKEVVASSQTPKVVQQILLEKVISRRNSIMKCFKIDAQSLPVDSKQNNGVELVDGKLTKVDWPGYASKFAFGDPDSPLSDSDLKSWIKSRAISTGLEIAVAQLNQLPYLGTDIKAISEDKFKGHLEQALQKSITEQKPFEMPLKAWFIPTFRGQLILNRNLVTGTYLGTDNLVQLVDTVGVSIGGGAFIGTMGIGVGKGATYMPVNLNASAEGVIMRTYSHLRPIFDLKKSLKYPFKNILVPLVKHDYGKLLHEAIQASIDPEASDGQRASKIEEVLRPFKQTIQIGESLIVTDSLITYVSVQAGADLYKKLLSLSLGVVPGQAVVSRFHVFRKSEHEFQIYKDIGHKGSLSISMDVDSLIPVIKASQKQSRGNAKVKFFTLNLDPKNTKVIQNASHLRSAIVHSSVRDMEENDIKPFVVKHKFRESFPQLNLLFWQWMKQNSSTEMTVQNPAGDERYFRRQYHGVGKGRNYQAYVNALISHWVGLLFDKKAGLSESTGTNPGYSFKGVAQTKYLTLDQEVTKDKVVMEPFIRLTRGWNGWSLKRNKAEKLLDEIKQKYRFEFFNAPVLNDTYKIMLYNLSVNMLFYEQGVNNLLNLSDDQIRLIFKQHFAQKSLVLNPANMDSMDTGAEKFIRFLNRYEKHKSRKNEYRSNKYLLKALSHAENKLYLSGLVALVGGEDNLYASARIDGFREGDESGDKPLISSSLGEIGSPRTLGPIVQVQRLTEMLEGEFFIYWLMTRLI